MGNSEVTAVVDAMGGDRAPEEIVKGALLFLKRNKGLKGSVRVVLVGDREKIESICGDCAGIEIIHTDKWLGMHEKWNRRDRENSLAVSMDIVKQRENAFLISAGNTGAVTEGSFFTYRMIEGVKRPAIPTIIPRFYKKEEPFVLLDAGANADCKPEFLKQFAIMGAAYYTALFGKARPKVALLNIGEENIKGNALVKETDKLMKDHSSDLYEYVGYIEGHTMFSEDVDVVVADGFVGNIVLKSLEGLAKELLGLIKDSVFMKLGVFLSGLYKKLKYADYREWGGAPLLGVKRLVIIAHGSSDAKAIANGIDVGVRLTERGLIGRIKSMIAED